MNLTPILKKLIARQDLTETEAFEAVTAILSGELTEGQIGAFLGTLRAKGETIDEIAAGARAMRTAATRIQSLTPHTLDTVGTGGDGGMTFNISTTVAFVAAGAGAVVAKHGNRASSGKSGSADCLECLGFNLAADPEVMEQALNEIGITFMFAPTFHKAMRFAGPVRKQMGVRTLFNLLGPLTNPAGAPCQLIGVFAPDLTEAFAEVLKKLGSRRVLVVHGHDGMDEITLTTTTRCSELKDGVVKTYDIDPAIYFDDYCTNEDLEGGEPTDNAAITRGILDGTITGPKRDIVLINSAASLMAGTLAEDLANGIKQSAEAIDSGAALKKLDELVEFSKS
ncbi:MAG: anthranilate phosphoribosyltransferase [Kiritimatiellae bacterium]|nr:anthranilate phosphoribosyltransferase [Kiritimatiellia bacterium]MDD4341625.1 anthranilate phosphoribosyltransferase [Kiritimatiellia bacterium]